MLFKALTTLFVDDRLIMPGEEFTPNPAKNHKPGGGWSPVDDEAKVAFAAAGSPEPYTGTVEIPVASVPENWVAAALAAGWQPVTPGQAPQYAAAPPAPMPAPVPAPAPVSPPVAAPAAAPVEAPPAAPVPEHDDGAI